MALIDNLQTFTTVLSQSSVWCNYPFLQCDLFVGFNQKLDLDLFYIYITKYTDVSLTV